jgi:predicted phosphodiesterase
MQLTDKNFEKIYIQHYNELNEYGKCKYNVADLQLKFGFKSKRSTENYEVKLRTQKKIKFRHELEKANIIIKTEKKFENDCKSVNWTVKPSQVTPNESRPYKVHLVTADHHVPYQNVAAVKSILQMMNDVKFDGFHIVGDYVDLCPISHWNKNKKMTTEGMRLSKHYIEGNRLLDEFDKRLPSNCEKTFQYGNHERFSDDFLEEYPQLQEMIEPSINLKLKERGYTTFTQQNSIVKLGKLYLTHGMFTGNTAVDRHLNSFSSNVMFGHTHTAAQKYKPCMGHTLSLAGFNIGALCDLNPDYNNNRLNNWIHGFAVVYVFSDNYFDATLKQIINGRFVFDGKVYNGK